MHPITATSTRVSRRPPLIRYAHAGHRGIPARCPRLILLNLDPPEHTKLRGIVSRGFTPRAIGSLRQVLTARARQIVATAAARRAPATSSPTWPCELPLQAIAELLGVPQQDRAQDLRLVQPDGRLRTTPSTRPTTMTAGAELVGYACSWPSSAGPARATTSSARWCSADVDGGALTTDEFGFFMILLAVAGNETTRNAISHGDAGRSWTTRSSGSCTGPSGQRRRWTRSSAGPPR